MKAKNLEMLAMEGGEAAVKSKIPALVRWGDEERRQLVSMIDQPSLFYWNGPQTKLLEERFRAHYPLKHVMPCSSGTAAIHAAVAAAGVGPGDEVIVPPITDMGTVIGILYQQGVPVFADLEPYRYNLDPADVLRKITPKTKAIIAVHLAGDPCDMESLRDVTKGYGVTLIEDCAQAWGAKRRGKPVGTLGDIGCFSLNDFKHIGCGDGGIVASSDPKFGPLLQKLCDKCYDRVTGSHTAEYLAPNYRMSEPQSAVAAVQFNRLEGITSKRNALGTLLSEGIKGLPGIRIPHVDKEDFCSYWFYMFRLKLDELSCDRETFVKALQAEGVPAGAGYIPMALYKYPVFAKHNFFMGRWPVKELGLTDMDYTKVCCPVAEEILETAVRLLLHQGMTEEYVREMAEGVRKVAKRFAR